MNKKRIVKILGTVIFISTMVVFLFFLMAGYEKQKVMAEATCPYTDPYKCLDYFYQLEKDLGNKKSSLQRKLNSEEYQQLSLQEKITYIDNQISETEKLIKSIQVEIAATDIEIKLAEKDIQEKEDSISLLAQEADILEQTVSQRVTESYKFSFVGPLEIFLDVKSLSTALRRTKYLIVTRSQDIESLETYAIKTKDLAKQEEDLTNKKADLQIKRNSIEEEKLELAKEINALAEQKTEKNKLLAESKARETAYLSQFNSISKLLAETEKAEEQLMLRLYQTGLLKADRYVRKGEVIGLDGHTGCSFGTHLHFSFVKNGYYTNPKTYLDNGTLKYPMTGVVITQYYGGSHYALDLVSTNSGYQGWDRYTVPYGLCPTVDSILNCRRYGGRYCSNTAQKPMTDWNLAYQRGEGAKVYAAMDGYFTHRTDKYGANYGMVISKDGKMVTYYVHLKY